MPKFKIGEFALFENKQNMLINENTKKYLGTVVQIIQFYGVHPSNKMKHEDWYEVEAEDNTTWAVREVLLRKLPDDYSPGACEEIFKKLKYSPPPRVRRAAVVTS